MLDTNKAHSIKRKFIEIGGLLSILGLAAYLRLLNVAHNPASRRTW